MINAIKTVSLLTILGAMFIWMGYGLGGQHGMWGAAAFTLLFNGFMYFNSSKVLLAMMHAQPLHPFHHEWVFKTADELAQKLNIPAPKLFIIPTDKANAFATGRNPNHAAIVITQGMLDALSHGELRGVIAHELSHVKHRDILIGTISTFLASTIGYMGNRLRYDPEAAKTSRRRPFAWLIMTALMPVAALLVRFGIARTREFAADKAAAYLTHKPLELAAALQKIHDLNKHNPFKIFNWSWAIIGGLCIEQPAFTKKIRVLLATHPPVSERVARLEQIYKKMFPKN